MKSWRELVHPIIGSHLEARVKETLQYKDAYSKAKDKGKAQLWIAVSNLSKQVISQDLKIKYLENVLKDISQRLNELKEKSEEQKEKKLIKKRK